MSDKSDSVDPAGMRVVLELADMQNVEVERDIEYSSQGSVKLLMDVYQPPDIAPSSKRPAVLLVTGHSDQNMERALGCKLKDSGAYISWAQLLAVSGVTGITYTNTDPGQNANDALDFIQENADRLNIDVDRIGIWSCSANSPNALSLLVGRGSQIRCSAFCYPYMFEVEGSNLISETAAQYGFANPNANKSIRDIPGDLPLFIARAGRDSTPGLNATIDNFVSEALELNLPLTLVNRETAPHSFDIFDDSPETRAIISGILRFYQQHLGLGYPGQ